MRGLGSGGGGGGGLRHNGGAILPSARRAPRRDVRLLAAPPRSLPCSSQFAVLGLTPFASARDVKHAYKRLALKYHPDVIRGETGQDKEETFKEIKSAYESLMVQLEGHTTTTNDATMVVTEEEVRPQPDVKRNRRAEKDIFIPLTTLKIKFKKFTTRRRRHWRLQLIQWRAMGTLGW